MLRVYLKAGVPKEIINGCSYYYSTDKVRHYINEGDNYVSFGHDLEILSEVLIAEMKINITSDDIAFISTLEKFNGGIRTPGVYQYKSIKMTVTRLRENNSHTDICTITASSFDELLDAKILFDKFRAGRALPYLVDDHSATEQPRPIMTVLQAWLEFQRLFLVWAKLKFSTL